MLSRVRQLEIEKAHPMLGKLGGEQGWVELQVDAEAGIADGRYDNRDMPFIILAVQGWLSGA